MSRLLLLIAGLVFCQSAASTNANIDSLIRFNVPKLMEQHNVPGVSLAILQKGRKTQFYYFGFANLASKQLLDEDSGFNVGSVSKSLTAWGIMKLVEQGKVALDSPVEKYISRWKIPKSNYNSSGVTVRRLLSHTSGLSQHAVPQFEVHEELPSVEESLKNSSNYHGDKVRLESPPGAQWRYSGGGYTVLQLLIEEVSGIEFSDFMEKEILQPLGMLKSSFEPDGPLLSTLAKSYDQAGNETARLVFTATGSAGLQTTLNDLTRFAAATLNRLDNPSSKAVLKAETITQMVSIDSNASIGSGHLSHRNYGFGYFVTDTEPFFYGHGGDNRGWHSRFLLYPNTNNGLVIMTNSSNGFLLAQQLTCLLQVKLTNTNAEDCS